MYSVVCMASTITGHLPHEYIRMLSLEAEHPMYIMWEGDVMVMSCVLVSSDTLHHADNYIYPMLVASVANAVLGTIGYASGGALLTCSALTYLSDVQLSGSCTSRSRNKEAPWHKAVEVH